MKQNTKNEIKDWLQLIALCAAGGIVVFHVNSFFKPAGAENPHATPQGIERVVEKVDSVVPHDTISAVSQIQAAREMFFSGLQHGLPQR